MLCLPVPILLKSVDLESSPGGIEGVLLGIPYSAITEGKGGGIGGAISWGGGGVPRKLPKTIYL